MKLEEFEKEMEIGSSGHYGEILNITSVHLSYVDYNEKFVELEIEPKGNEPD
jgi:hypothetical protein